MSTPTSRPEAPATGTSRRGFLSRLAGGAAAAAALLLLPRCGSQEGEAGHEDDDDFGMHGPIRIADKHLKYAEAPSAWPLFAPYDDGEPFTRRWAVAHVARGPEEQLVVVLVDLDTGGHAEVELRALTVDIRPVAQTARYGVFVDNGGRGDAPTPRHLRKLAEALADVIVTNEDHVQLGWTLPPAGLRRGHVGAPVGAAGPALSGT